MYSGGSSVTSLGGNTRSSDSTEFWKLIEQIFLLENVRQRVSSSVPEPPQHGGKPLIVTQRPLPGRDTKKRQTGCGQKGEKGFTNIGPSHKPERKIIDIEIRKRLEERYSLPHNSHSEAEICDHYIEYIPAAQYTSEKLWKYVSKKKQVDLKRDKLPGLKTNEAIFNGLKQKANEPKNRPRKNVNKKKQTNLGKTQIVGNDKTKRICNSVSEIGRSKFNLKSSSSGLVKQPKKDGDAKTAEQEIGSCKEMYDGVLKQRLNCGCKLETLNKCIIKSGNPKSTSGSINRKRYNEVKNEYLKLCYQESNLRHQISLLNAEIYMMQSKQYHKCPVSLSTITMETQLPSERRADRRDGKPEGNISEMDFQIFSPFKIRRNQPNNVRGASSAAVDSLNSSRQSFSESEMEDLSELMVTSSKEWRKTFGVCSLYDLSPDLPKPMKPPSYLLTQRGGFERGDSPIYHRLPRLKAPPPSAVPPHEACRFR